MEILNDVKELSPKLQVPPLREGEVAVFRLKKAGLLDGLHEEPTCPEIAQFSGVEQVNDPGEKGKDRNKKIGTFIKEYKQVQNQLKPVFAPVTFIRGYCRVGADDHGTYTMLMRSKKSGANRFRKLMGAKGEPVWELVGQDQVVSQLLIEELKFLAQKAVKEASIDQLKVIAQKLNSSPDQRLHVASYKAGVKEDPQSIKLELMLKAKTYYKQIVYACDDATSKKQVEVYDGLTYGILYFDKNKGYQLTTVDGDTEDIFKPTSGEEPVDCLLKYFESKEGEKTYKKFIDSLKKALKISAS